MLCWRLIYVCKKHRLCCSLTYLCNSTDRRTGCVAALYICVEHRPVGRWAGGGQWEVVPTSPRLVSTLWPSSVHLVSTLWPASAHRVHLVSTSCPLVSASWPASAHLVPNLCPPCGQLVPNSCSLRAQPVSTLWPASAQIVLSLCPTREQTSAQLVPDPCST